MKHSLVTSVLLYHFQVLDVNDNPPTFSMPSYSCFISDSASQGQLVTKVMAFDPDESDAGNLFYSIVEGNEKLTFSMDPASGGISLSQQQKPALSAPHTLVISVSDGVYASFARVSVDVRSTNHYTPVFGKDVYNVVVSEHQVVGATVVTATAVDEDRGNYGRVTYSIVSDEMAKVFSIDADTGKNESFIYFCEAGMMYMYWKLYSHREEILIKRQCFGNSPTPINVIVLLLFPYGDWTGQKNVFWE